MPDPSSVPAPSPPTPGLAQSWSKRCAQVLMIASALYVIGCGLYGIDAPLTFGHHGYHVGEYSTRARHTLRHGSILPANLPGWNQPAVENHYLHHPILTHQLVTVTMGLFGERVSSVRLAAVLYMLSTLLALMKLLWHRAGPWPTALSSLVFAVVPIHVWYGNHIDPGFPGLTCLLLFFDEYFRFLDDGRWRSLGLSLVWALLAGFFEWSPYLAAIPVFLHTLWQMRRRGRFVLYPFAYGFAVALPFVIHVAIVLLTHHLPELREGYASRTVMPPWSTLLGNLLGFSDELFGRTLLTLTGLYVLSRPLALWKKGLRPLDLVGLSLGFSLALYIKLFPVGVTIHQYRLLYGGVIASVALAQLAHDLAEVLRWLWRSCEEAKSQVLVSTLLCAVTLLGTAKLSWQGLLQSRLHGGILSQRHFEPLLSRIEFVVYAHDLTQPGDVGYIHGSFHLRKELYYYLDRDIAFSPSLFAIKELPMEQRARAFVLCSPRAMLPHERAIFDELALRHPTYFVDDYVMLDLRGTTPGRTVKHTRPSTQRRSMLRRYFEGPYTRLSLVE